MKNFIIILLVAMLFASCNSTKRNLRLLSEGEYEQAIELAVKKLQKDKSAGKNDARIVLLEDAFAKAIDEDTRSISFLKKQNTPQATRKIFYTYQNMEYYQSMIRPLLPLHSASLNRYAKFKMVDYSNDIILAKNNYLNALYNEADIYMNRQTIDDYRTAYNIYCDIDELQSNYKNVTQLKDDARFYGTDFVHVQLYNRSGQLIPLRLERDLLDFNTYGLDDFWTQYHSVKERDIDYNFGVEFDIREISVAPERMSEVEERRSKRIKDGWEYVYDRRGNVKKDSLGNDIKIDKYITVNARITFTTQTKATIIGGDVVYKDLVKNRLLNRYPMASEFIFENEFARFRGDERALTPEDRKFLKRDYIPFPTSEQMVFDAGEDLKLRLKDILKNNGFR
ncbi:hypothetical protein ULMS_21360 [Patiriisocius marinistellae]|uniref:Lipoprotein n=1 Tax=Patiriisocius marinistellae TaxID=2494560 RepID=A0A5J4FZ08_9FLAO|nr:hypothetical protein [Patiriisocius marinistellae]GEQ86628.1 hypothetical protein ULMS_21360 [Patiriisocius marinistellae]